MTDDNNDVNNFHLRLLHADSKVALVELVRYVPSEWTELASLLNERVEKAQTEQHFSPPLALHTAALSSAAVTIIQHQHQNLK